MERVGVRLVKHDYKADAASVAYDAIEHARAKHINVVLIDTAGRQVTDKNLMNELRENRACKRTRSCAFRRGQPCWQ